MNRPTPAQDFAVGMVLVTVALWGAFVYGVVTWVRDAMDVDPLGGDSDD